ncbi:MAG: hypothetical protein ABI325_09605 [Ginsengibacter sp.]
MAKIIRVLSDDTQVVTDYICSMADIHFKETRSYNMSRIKGKNTKPEMLVRKFLHANGFRYNHHFGM